MIKCFLKQLFLFILFSITSYGQEKILEFNTDYPDFLGMAQDSFTLIDETNNEFTIFITIGSDIAAYHFDSNMENKGRLVSRQLENKFNTPLGGTIRGNQYSLFYTNNNRSRFSAITFDFDTRRSKVSEIDLKFKTEILLTQFNYKNKFHLLTVSSSENIMYLYIFDSAGGYKKDTIDLSNYDFFHISDHSVSLKTALSRDILRKPLSEITWIEKDVPYSLDSLISLYKLYLVGDTISLVFDINSNFTQIINYDLNQNTINCSKIAQPAFKKDAVTNSYLFDNKLFQFKINPKEMTLRITDITTNVLLRDHHITKDDNLYLSVSPIKQRGGRYKSYREMSETPKFLRKVGTGNPGIYVDAFEENYGITLGSVEEIDNSAFGALSLANPFGVFATIGSLTLFVNPVALAFYNSSSTKAVYTNGYLNAEFNPVDGIERDNIFYTINDYLDSEDIKRFSASNVFKYQSHYIFGKLDKKTKTYSLIKF